MILHIRVCPGLRTRIACRLGWEHQLSICMPADLYSALHDTLLLSELPFHGVENLENDVISSLKYGAGVGICVTDVLQPNSGGRKTLFKIVSETLSYRFTFN